MFQRSLLILMVFGHLLWGCVVATAQEGATETPTAGDSESETEAASPANLGVIHLLDDEDGKLVPVPQQGISPAEFMRLRDQAMGVGSQSQRKEYEILSLEATGAAVAGGGEAASAGEGKRVEFEEGSKPKHVDLTVAMEIAVQTDREKWIRIPLRFGEAALRTEPGASHANQWRVVFEDPRQMEAAAGSYRGYVLWLRGRGEEAIEKVELEFSVPLSTIGRERRMALSVPSAAKSELRLKVPMAEVVASESGSLVETEKAGQGATSLLLRGFRGDIDLVWRPPDVKRGEAAPILASQGRILATVSRHFVKFDAALTVSVDRTYGRQLSEFEVRLPSGAILTEWREEKAGYTLTDVTPKDQESDEGRLVKVALLEPVAESGAVRVRLRAITDTSATVDGRFLLGGFEVARADNQRGYVGIIENGEWEIDWDLEGAIERTSEVPEELEGEEVVAKYHYTDQPFTLAARVFPKEEWISVEPWYVLRIESETAYLAATLKYAVRGDEAYQLKIDMNAWEFESVGPEQYVIPTEDGPDDSGTLTVHLQEGMMEQFELSLKARRPIDPSDPQLTLSLPKPNANSTRSAALIVLPDDNIALEENVERIEGLERQKVPPPESLELPASLKLPEMGPNASYYRGKAGDVSEAVFAAVMRVREQQVSVGVSSKVRLAPDQVEVTQQFQYDVKYEPTGELKFLVPEALADSGAVEYALDGDAVAVQDTGETTEDGLHVHRIRLASPREGQFQLEAVYTNAVSQLHPSSTVPWTVPLIMPSGVRLTGNRLEMRVPDAINLWGHGGPWQKVRSERSERDGAVAATFTTDTSENEIAIRVSQMDPDLLGSTVVHAAWIQTWMTARQRADRAVFRLVSDRGHFVVSLPQEADTESLQVVMDGALVEDFEISDHEVRIALPQEQGGRERVVDMWYRANSRPAPGGMALELPRLAEDVSVRRSYWQLLLPANEHVVSAPLDYTAEYDWAWNGVWWGRVPVMEQSDLEEWIGAVSYPEMTGVPETTSRYLFSRFGEPGPVQLRTAGRTTIVAGASGLVLLIGLLLIYVPAARHPVFGLLIVVAAGASAIAWPGTSLLFAQAAGLGVAFSLLAAVLYRAVARRRRRTPRRDSSSSFVERGSTQAQFGSSEVEVLGSPPQETEVPAVHAPERG